MTELLKAIKAQFKNNRWSCDLSEANRIASTMTAVDVEAFFKDLMEFAPSLKDKLDHADVLSRFFQANSNVTELASEDTLTEYIDFVIDNEDVPLVLVGNLHEFKNLTLDHVRDIINYEPRKSPDEEDEPNRSWGYYSKRSELLEHSVITQDFLDELASERYEDFLCAVVGLTENPETLYKCCLIASKNDNEYSIVGSAMNNKILDQDMLERIAELGDTCASHVLNCRKTKKELINKISISAKGRTASSILQVGKTPPETLIAVVDNNDDPEVLVHLAYNRSKKVPMEALLKAYSKLPDNSYYYKQKFIKRADFGKAIAELVRQKTGLQASVEDDNGNWSQPQLTETQEEAKVA